VSAGNVGAGANLVIAVSYLVITGVMAVPLVRARQVRANRLGTATVAIFFTCAVHHGALGVLAVAATAGVQLATGAMLFVCNLHSGPEEALAATGPLRIQLVSVVTAAPAWDWYSVGWDVFGAAIGLYYLTLRKTYRALMRGPVLFEDLKEQQLQALEINDNIVRGLTVAHLALELDDVEKSAAALDETLASARAIISNLLEDPHSRVRLGPGDLVRQAAASAAPPRERRHR